MPEEVPADGRAQSVDEGDVQPKGGTTKARVRVVTDSGADLDRAVAAQHGVSIVHLDVRLGEFGPETTSTWSPEQFWERSADIAELPETSAPSPGEFKQAFLALADEGAEGVVCITLSSKLSATYQAAVIGAESVTDRIRVEVVDSLFATMAEGLIVLDAVAAAETDGDIEAVAAAAIASTASMQLFGALDSLDNLRKGGRLGSAQALLGGLLDIKPVLQIRDGVLELESRPGPVLVPSSAWPRRYAKRGTLSVSPSCTRLPPTSIRSSSFFPPRSRGTASASAGSAPSSGPTSAAARSL